MKTTPFHVGALGVACIAAAASFAFGIAQPVAKTANGFEAGQAFTADIGSKRVVGFYVPQNGACSVTAMVSEGGEDAPATTAARMRVSVPVGAEAAVESAEGEGVAIRCEADAARVSLARIAVGS